MPTGIYPRKPMSQVTKDKIAQRIKGIKRSIETRRKIGEAQKGRPINWKAIYAMREKTLGNKFQLGRKHTPEEIQKIIDAQTGDKHWAWKGNSVGYASLHAWLRKHYGKPRRCELCLLDDPNRRYHWANKTGKYLRDISDWFRLCVSCHKKHDLSLKKFAYKTFHWNGNHYTHRLRSTKLPEII